MDNNKNKSNEEHYHEYDGIIEHNNPMPGWWTWSFILSVVFAVIYFIHYQIGDGPTLQDELKVALQQHEAMKASAPAVVATVNNDDLNQKLNDQEFLKAGGAIFKDKCAMCHGQNLEGTIGPNLTDSSWIHGKGQLSDIIQVMRTGVADKGMPPWNGVISDEDMQKIAVYIKSHRNTKPANAKKSEGVEYPDYLN